MNIIIYSVNPQSPHLAVDMELAMKFKSRGDKVTIVRCTSQLRACLVNPNHNPLICGACKSKYSKAFDLADIGDLEIISLPPNNNSYDELPKVFNDIEALKSFKFHGLEAGVAVASTLIGRFNRDHKFDTIKYRKQVYRELQMWVDVYFGMDEILTRVSPDEVYFFNGRFSSIHPVMFLCARKTIPFYTHERAGVMNKYIVRRNAMPHTIDYSTMEMEEMWGEGGPEKETIGAKFFTDRRNNVIQSWLSHTESQEKGLLPAGFDRSKKNVAIFNSTIEEYEGMDEWQNTLYRDENEGIQRTLESFRGDKSYMFYLRVHPNLKLLKNTQMKELISMSKKYENLFLIGPSEKFDSYALMDNADYVITFGSTMGAEVTFWGKPSVLLGKAMYLNIDACYQPLSHEEAMNLIRDVDLAPKNRLSAVKYGYWELMRGIFFEKFKQVDLFTLTRDGEELEAKLGWRIAEKISKLGLIRNKRDIDGVKQKIKKLVGWK